MFNSINQPYARYKEVLAYFLFWCLVFLLDLGPHWENYGSSLEIIQTIGIIVVLQFTVAVLSIKLLIPKLLDKEQKLLFFISLLALLILVSELSVLYRSLYIERSFPESYTRFLQLYGHLTLQERTLSLWSFKYIFFSKIPLMLFPASILIAHNFYQNQKKLLQIKEQKKQAELAALKNQLNPHFIFNTLNNLYTLALLKSDETPIVIEKLSDILDYILYRCDENYVPLTDEISLINNYLSLEKIRYGERLQVHFEHQVSHNIKIAPLILLSLVENACKHGTSQELNSATINIKLVAADNQVEFNISNSKPKLDNISTDKNQNIGLINIRRQLGLIYPERHQLKINEHQFQFQVTLKLF